MSSQSQPARKSDFIDGFLRSPLSGIAPWILMAVVAGPGRFAEAAAGALGLTLVVLWAGGRRGIKVHSLEVFGAVVFGIFVGFGILGSPGVLEWLSLWAGVLTNGGLAAFTLASIAFRRPFTMAYAKDTVDAEHWSSPLFIRVNYVLTSVWASAFLFSTVVGGIGDAFLHDGDNFWTGWILQIGATLAAVAVTEFYPEYARAKFLLSTGESMDAPPSLLRVLDWLPPFVVAIGIAAWSTDSLPEIPSIALIVVGVLGGSLMRKFLPSLSDNGEEGVK